MPPQKNIKWIDIVLLINQRATRLDWPIARVQEVIPSKDGFGRLCWVRMPIDGKQVLHKEKRTKRSLQPRFFRRGIEELCLLESDIEQREDSNDNGVELSRSDQNEDFVSDSNLGEL